MDQRKLKTQQAIQNAFLQLRKEKNLEQISITELSRLAKISKATFYLHYRDIFDLSEKLQSAAIRCILEQIKVTASVLDYWPEFSKKMMTILAHDNTITTILFSGSQMAMFPVLLENQLRESIWAHSPELKEDLELNIRLTYHIQGCYHAYLRHSQNADPGQVLNIIADMKK